MKNLKLIILTIIIMGIFVLLGTSSAQAALQSNPNTKYNTRKKPEQWMKQFRNVEKASNGMGLSEDLNADLTFSGKSNNIDIHMMRSTEYGAIAILSASGYGNPSNDRVMTSTTGNKTGVIMEIGTNVYNDTSEFVAAGYEGKVFSGVNPKYYDTYKIDGTERVGDALGTATGINPGCRNWHSASESGFNYSSVENMIYLVRGGYYGLFHFRYYGTYSGSQLDNYSRGVAICGEGL